MNKIKLNTWTKDYKALQNVKRQMISWSSSMTKYYNTKTYLATGIDEVTYECFKSVSTFSVSPFEHIIDFCIEKGVWPTACKTTVVIPIYKKKGDKYFLDNYRPIPLISQIPKAFENFLKQRWSSYLKEYNLVSHKTTDLKKNSSTQDALLNLTKRPRWEQIVLVCF